VLSDVEVVTPLRQPTRSASPIAPTPVIEVPQPVGTLSGPTLEYRREGSLGATLAHEPGVSNTAFGPGAGRPVIRGQGGERIRVLENGTGTLDVSGLSDDHAVPVDATSVDRLEIVRGPATLRYGASAIGGIVYAHDGRIPETPVGRHFMGRLGGGFGTADTERSGYAVLSGQEGCWCWRASGFARETDDLDIPGFAKSRRQLEAEGNPGGVGEAFGTLPNSWARAWGGSLGLSRVGTWGHTGLAVSTFSTDYGLPNEEDVHIELDRLRVDASGRHAYPLAGLKAASWSLAFADYEHTEFEGPDAGTIFDQQAGEGRIEIVHCPWGCWEGALGLQGSLTDLQVTGEEALLPEARTATAGVFLVEKRPLSSCWSLEVGARCDFTSIESVGDETFSALSLSTGLLWKPAPGTVWALSAAYTERAPTAFELFANGPHVATETFEVGDPGLGLEQAVGADLSWRRDGRRLSASATAFYDRYRNYIALVPTGASDAMSGFEIFDYVGHEAELYGFEAQLTWHAWRCGSGVLDVEGRADSVRANDVDAGEPLPRIPPLRVGGGVAWHDPRWTARVDLLHAFEQDRTTSFEFPTDGYTLLDAGVSRTWSSGCRSFTLALTGTNLLDEEVRLSTSFIKDLAPGRGRSLLLSFKVDF
jgi:iron complex outermembrane receptor protein